MKTEWINLPFEIQLFLASGYIAYRVAASGLEKTHQKTDTFFQILIYGVIAKFAYEISQIALPDILLGEVAVKWVSVLIAFILPPIAAALWRKYLKDITIWIIRKTDVSIETFTGPTLSTILQERNNDWSYISVRLADGSYLESNLAALPIGLISNVGVFDEEGNVAIYVTYRIDPKGKATEYTIGEDVLDHYGREHLTYIPASQIVRMKVSRVIKKKFNSREDVSAEKLLDEPV